MVVVQYVLIHAPMQHVFHESHDASFDTAANLPIRHFLLFAQFYDLLFFNSITLKFIAYFRSGAKLFLNEIIYQFIWSTIKVPHACEKKDWILLCKIFRCFCCVCQLNWISRRFYWLLMRYSCDRRRSNWTNSTNSITPNNIAFETNGTSSISTKNNPNASKKEEKKGFNVTKGFLLSLKST